MKYIKELPYFNGETLFNVPAELGTLIEMGFSEERAAEICLEAEHAALWEQILSARNARLTETDFTQVGDAPITPEKKGAFATYRQALRDLPQNFSNPNDVVWPEKPTS